MQSQLKYAETKTPPLRAAHGRNAERLGPLARRAGQQAFALRTLAGELAGPAHGFGALARTLFRRLFVMVAALHLAESAFPLHLLFERLQRLVDVVVANENLYQDTSPVEI
jgi:hypothetical protein